MNMLDVLGAKDEAAEKSQCIIGAIVSPADAASLMGSLCTVGDGRAPDFTLLAEPGTFGCVAGVHFVIMPGYEGEPVYIYNEVK